MALVGGFSMYYLVRKTVENNIKSELSNTTNNVLNMVRTAAQSSIRNRLRAVATTNRDVAAYFHSQAVAGKMTDAEARKEAESILRSQRIGANGYIYCLNSKGVLVMHPKGSLGGSNISEYEFIKDQMARKEGYLEYEWKNPDDLLSKPKALFMVYFEPWDWIISASAYREEFSELISVEDFAERVLSIRFAQSGYSYIIDSKGNSILHPYLTGNFYNAKDSYGTQFVHVICREKHGQIAYTWKNPNESDYRLKLAYFNYLPEYDWIVVSTSYHDEFFAPLKDVRNIFILMAFIAALFVIPLSIGISRKITRSIEHLKAGFEQGASGNLSVRMTPKSQDEIGRLTLYFNDFMERLEDEQDKRKHAEQERFAMSEQLRQSQKMESIGQLAGGIAHDFNNILAAILGSAELLALDNDKKENPLISNIVQATTRATGLTRNLLDFSRKGTIQSIPVDLNNLIRESAQLLSHSIDKRIQISVFLESVNSKILGDPAKLQNSFLNLGINSRDAMPNGGSLDFTTRDVIITKDRPVTSGILKAGSYVEVSVKDSGNGIATEHIDKIFDPFFTTKPQGKGTGLGLASVYGCVTVHGGEIDLTTEHNKGTCFKIYLPHSNDKIEINGEQQTDSAVVFGTGTIMIVDDEDLVRSLMTEALSKMGYEIQAFGDPQESVEYFKDHFRQIDLIVLDLIMPKMSGEDTLKALLEIDKDIPILIASGFSERQEVGDLIKEGAKHYIRKPFQLKELSMLVTKYKRKTDGHQGHQGDGPVKLPS